MSIEKTHPQIRRQRKRIPRVVVCLITLIDLALESGWNGDEYYDWEQRQADLTRLRRLIEAGHIHLYIPSMLIAAVHTAISKKYGIGQAYRIVDKLLHFVNITSEVDFERILEQTNEILLMSEKTLDFYDVLPLTYAVALQVDAFITQEPNSLSSIYQILPMSLASKIPILTVGAIFQYLLDQDCSLDKGSILVLTPEQHVIPLPQDATPVDFAYKIHSEVGHRCVRAFVNGKEVSLSSKLKNGDVVSIEKGDVSLPDPKWSEFVQTRYARQSIRRGWKHFHIEKGWEMLNQEIGPNPHLYRHLLESVARKLEQKVDDLVTKVGTGEMDVPTLQALMLEHSELPLKRDPLTQTKSILLDGRPCKLASCCSPFPNDSIVGVLGRNKRVLCIHRSICHKLKSIEASQQYPIEWNGQVCWVQLSILLNDKADTLRPLLNRLVDNYGLSPDIRSVSIDKSGQCWVVLKLNVASRQHIDEIVGRIRSAPEVRRVKKSRNLSVACPDGCLPKEDTISLFSGESDP